MQVAPTITKATAASMSTAVILVLAFKALADALQLRPPNSQ